MSRKKIAGNHKFCIFSSGGRKIIVRLPTLCYMSFSNAIQPTSILLLYSRSKFMREKVQAAIDKIRPALQKDGGDVILVDVSEDGIVKVQLTGACKGCPMSQMTLKDGIEKFVKSEIPEVVSVESV